MKTRLHGIHGDERITRRLEGVVERQNEQQLGTLESLVFSSGNDSADDAA